MKKKIKFNPQQFFSVMVEAVTSAYFIDQGLDSSQAVLIGKSLGGIVKGFSLTEDSTSDKIFSSLQTKVSSIIDSGSFELTDACKKQLKENAFSPDKIIDFMCRQDSYSMLRNQIIQICEKDTDWDITTFSIDELTKEIFYRFDDAAKNNPELANYIAFRMQLMNKIPPEVYVANKQYVDSFIEPLFLHKEPKNSRVSLKNLFILQKYKFLNENYSKLKKHTDDSHDSLQDVIATFLKGETPFLFIEGDAGCGKTSLISWMNFHYWLEDETAAHLFNERPLITVRLRDLNKKDISEKSSLSTAILKYMHIESLDELERRFPKAIMILDGFDELCMIEGLGTKHDHLLYDLRRKKLDGFQFIITTRPKFIPLNIDLPSEFISLEHFDAEQRAQWLERYTSNEYCAQTIDETIYSYIQSIDDDSSSCICDTPMTLYMLVAKKGATDFLENNWSLYHHIFFEELSETEYNAMFPDPERKYNHDISFLKDVIYQISEEISFKMYQKENQSFYLSDSELKSIIKNLSEKNPILLNANLQDITKNCYAICCYWKSNSDQGAVEFLHNNIRDFFLAEKIYREMNEVICNAKRNHYDKNLYKVIANKLCSLFKYGVLETKVSEFLFLRAKYDAENNNFNFVKYEYTNKLITKILLYMSRQCFVENNIFSENLFATNPVQIITSILTCTIQLYRHVYEPYLDNSETIQWIPESPYKNNIMTPIFKSIFCQVPVTVSEDCMITLGSRGYFNHMNFKTCDLRNIGFQYSEIKNADLSDTILCGCDFSNTKLDGTDFSNADVHYASFVNASLLNCNMTGTDLRGTELPDGFVSLDQSVQIEHLKSLKIKGLVI